MQAYFGYGSNMDAAQMRERCPGAKFRAIAVLPDYRLFITSDGFATVIPDPGRRVMGALWLLGDSDEAALDRYEDIGSGLYRREYVGVHSQGQVVEALIYVAANVNPGTPRPGYLELVVAAARNLGLPADYIRELQQTA